MCIRDRYEKAQLALKSYETTKSTSCFAAYVTRYKNRSGIYFHSNFVKYGHEYPTKIWTNMDVSILDLFLNSVCSELTSQDEALELRACHERSAVYLIDSASVKIRGDDFFAGALNIVYV